MKETDKKRGSNNNQTTRSAKSGKKDSKLQGKNGGKTLRVKESDLKSSSARPDSCKLVSHSNMGAESSEVYENMDIHYLDDVYRSEEASKNSQLPKMVDNESGEKVDDHTTDLENDPKEGMEEESDHETTNDSESSQGDFQTADDVKVERAPELAKSLAKNDVSKSNSHTPRVKSDRRTNNVQMKSPKSSPKQIKKPTKGLSNGIATNANDNPKNMKVHPKPSSESSEGVDDIPLEEVKEVDVPDEDSSNAHSIESDDETLHPKKNGEHDDKEASNQKIEEMEIMIGKLEEELREVAALEIALYSVVPEHGSSAHKVHTPARRLSRLYLHACKYWSQDKRATVARNTVSGLVLIARSCGNDVARLTFWLSNTVVLREIISQAFGSSCQSSSLTKILESNGGAKRNDPKSSSLKWKSNSGGKQAIQQGLMQFIDDWEETRTFTAALERVEAWIFSRIVESIWWQTLAPNMQSPSDDATSNKAFGRLLGPALGDQQQGSFSIDLWKNAFQDAFKRLCPVRAGGHECGCLPVLARQVMEQCVGRLDVAMFNAILRESAHEIPTDPVSDPIVDCRVLPIPAGDLSFGSGAQLKNSVGNWSRCLNDLFGMEANDSERSGQSSSADDKQGGDEPKCFHLLNELSDLLMLPKDMVMDRAIRMEVCPSIGLSLVKRILCNFSPDEFCPDPVPGAVLEALNAECIIERRFSGDSVSSSFPFVAAPVTYAPPSSANVAEKVAEAGGNHQLARSASAIQKKGYTSDEELEELDSPLSSIVDKLPSADPIMPNGSGKEKDKDGSGYVGANARYELLREVWLTT